MALQVAPAIVDVQVERGQVLPLTIKITNCGVAEVSLEVFPADLELSPEGLPLVRPAGLLSHSCAGWLELEADGLVLVPGEAQSLKAQVRVPANAQGGAYGVIALRTTLDREDEQAPMGVGVTATTGTVLMLSVKGPAAVRAVAEGLSAVVDAPEGTVKFAADIRNTGNIHFRCAGQLVVFGPDRRVAARLPLTAGTGTVLPGGVRRLTASWTPKRLASGLYRAEASVTIPRYRTLRLSEEFQVP